MHMTTRTLTVAAAAILATGMTLTGCAQSDETSTPTTTEAMTDHEHDHSETAAPEGHDHMDHPADGGPAPAGMIPAANPKFPVGSEVILKADHMPGMDGARATVVGAYDETYTYSIDYTPVDGGDEVKDHRWVVQQEIEDAGEGRLADGSEVTVTADHMKGMEGATATIAYSTDETVYMVDLIADGMEMKNHKWVVESEMEPAS